MTLFFIHFQAGAHFAWFLANSADLSRIFLCIPPRASTKKISQEQQNFNFCYLPKTKFCIDIFITIKFTTAKIVGRGTKFPIMNTFEVIIQQFLVAPL